MTDDRYGGQVPPPPTSPPVPGSESWQASPTWAPPTEPAYGSAPQAEPAYGSAPRRRVPRWLIAVAAATMVGSVAAFTIGLLWPVDRGHTPAGPLTFHGFLPIGQIDYGEPSSTAFTTVQGDRAYVGWEQDGNLRVSAFDLTDAAVRWQTTVSGAPRWGRLIASPHVLLVLAHEIDSAVARTLFARDPDTGDERWEIEVRGDDRLFFTDRVLGWLDRSGGALRGIDLVTGEQRWSHEFEGAASVLEVSTQAALAQPTDRAGQAHPLGADPRLVLVTADRTVKVIDGHDGSVISERANVAQPRDLVLAFEDHLYVVGEQPGYRVESYNLSDLAEPPRTIYSAAELDRSPRALEPCGSGRVCVLDTLPFVDEATAAVAINVDGTVAWQQQVPGGQGLLPVGDWLAVPTRVNFESHVVALDHAGEIRHTQPGVPARLNDGNFIVLDPQLRGATGYAVAMAQATALGPLLATTADQCAWSDRHIVCVGREAAHIWRFAEPG